MAWEPPLIMKLTRPPSSRECGSCKVTVCIPCPAACDTNIRQIGKT